MNIRYDRQEALWGRKGQKIIRESSIIISGADKLGLEVAKSASILGVGNIYILDNLRGTHGAKFLDMPFEDDKSKVKSLERMIEDHLNPDCCVQGLEGKATKRLMNMLPTPDMVIDVSNNPREQIQCLDYCRSSVVPLITAAVNRMKGKASLYNPLDADYRDNFELILPGYEDATQGIIMSNLFAGIIVEEFRKILFQKYRGEFAGEKVMLADGELIDHQKKIDRERVMIKDIFYNINGAQRFSSEENDLRIRGEGDLKGKKILLLAGGALGSYIADMATRLHPEQLDTADFDIYVEHNLNRQPLGYDGVGRMKSIVLSEKIKKISNNFVKSKGIIGYVGDKKDEFLEEELKKIRRDFPHIKTTPKQVTLLNKAWFAKQDYDLIISGFDNMEVRKKVNQYMIELGQPYIDCGSSPAIGRANIYVPGKTKCIECSQHLSHYSPFDDQANAALKAKPSLRDEASNLRGCAFVAGSVNMGNQAAAALGLAEARVVLYKKYKYLIDKVMYDSHGVSKLQQSKKDKPCQCGK